ncbi:MAG: hypothetical protein ACTSSI_02175 [Candidatus Helarchaeota archaeon]
MTYDNFFKQVLSDFLCRYDIHQDVSVGKLPLKIDLVVKRLKNPQKEMTIPLLERYFKDINLIEFKSSHDRPKKQDLAKLIGYLGLYCNQYGLGIENICTQFTLWYISARQPSFFKELIKKKILLKMDYSGFYRLQVSFPCPYFLLIINELKISEQNLPLLLLSSGDTLKKTIRLMVREGIIQRSPLEKYLSLVFLINYKEVCEMTEIKSRLPESVRENIRLAIKHIGIKEVINKLGWDEIIKEVGLKELIKEIGLKELIKEVDLKELIKEVDLKELIKEVDLKELIKSIGIDKIDSILGELKEDLEAKRK